MRATGGAQESSWFTNFGYYAFWFLLCGGLFWLLQPVYSDQMPGYSFWTVKILQAMLGMGVG